MNISLEESILEWKYQIDSVKQQLFRDIEKEKVKKKEITTINLEENKE